MATLLEDELVHTETDSVVLKYNGQEGALIGWTAVVGGRDFTAKDIERAIIGACRGYEAALLEPVAPPKQKTEEELLKEAEAMEKAHLETLAKQAEEEADARAEIVKAEQAEAKAQAKAAAEAEKAEVVAAPKASKEAKK